MSNKEQKEIIPPIAVEEILAQLDGKFFRPVNKGNWELYDINKQNAPDVVKEIGRLRELTFRAEGGGTGKDCDIDEYDDFFEQLVLWDPDRQGIVGGYRYAVMQDLKKGSKIYSPTGGIFKFSQKFLEDYLPYSIELGRSFVVPHYQPKMNRKGIFSLDNLWDGLGGLTVKYPQIKNLFGKVTMYPSFNSVARNLIILYLRNYHQDQDNLMSPIFPLPGLEKEIEKLTKEVDLLEKLLKFSSQEAAFNALINVVKTFGETVPPLIKQYFDLAPTTRYFGTSISPDFGNVEESGILVTIDDIKPDKKNRHIQSYKKYLEGS